MRTRSFRTFPRLLADVTQRGARPGMWIRPLQAAADVPDNWRLARDRNVARSYRAPACARKSRQTSRGSREWGCAMIKHDYSTYDIFGRWGNQMGSALTRDGWTFAEGPRADDGRGDRRVVPTRSRTAAGDVTIIGCNTVSHLSAGRVRCVPNRRRHERHRMGADAEDGRQHARIPRRAARRVLRGRSRTALA